VAAFGRLAAAAGLYHALNLGHEPLDFLAPLTSSARIRVAVAAWSSAAIAV
jgi:hypothetical protein